MGKIIYNIPFTKRQTEKINQSIVDTINNYIKRNNIEEDNNTIEMLQNKAKDQLIVYVSDMSHLNERWGLEHKILPVTIYTKLIEEDISILDKEIKNRNNYFYKKAGKWYMVDEEKDGYLTRQDFIKTIYSIVYDGAEVAAFYAIDSYRNVKERGLLK